MARDLQDGFDDMVREAELDDIKSQANKIMNDETFDAAGTLADEFDVDAIEKDWRETVEDMKAATEPEKDPANAGSTDLDQGPISDNTPQNYMGEQSKRRGASSKEKSTDSEIDLNQKQPNAEADSDAEPEKHES